jgi:hypothetical protein
MKKLVLLPITILGMIVFNACQHESSKQAAQAELQLNPNDSVFTVNDGGYTFRIILPKDIMIANAAVIQLNSATGDLHIQCGEQFWIVASLEKTDMAGIKTTINEDMLFTSKIIEETNNSLLYQRLLPDGAAYDYNYRSICDVAGKSYTFRTSEEGEFSLESVNRMKASISSVRESV